MKILSTRDELTPDTSVGSTMIPLLLPTDCPPISHSTVGVTTRFSITVAVQVRVYDCPAVASPVDVMTTCGAGRAEQLTTR